MKVVAINGSSRENGNTATALNEVCRVLEEHGIVTERIEVGSGAIHGCTGCRYCGKEKNRRCVFDDDVLNENLETLFEADGLLIGSPVYFTGVNGTLKCFLDRAFSVARANDAIFRHKVGAAVVAVRRGGEIAAWDQINKYFTISEMFVPSSSYWNMVFGSAPGEAAQDTEGMQTMQVLAKNMAWLLKNLSQTGQTLPPPVEKIRMNFIR